MSKFSEFVESDKTSFEVDDKLKKEKEKEDLSNLIDKYSTYSESELMNEFISESEKRKNSGEFSEENLSKIKNVLSPYLNETQKQKLNDLLNMVK